MQPSFGAVAGSPIVLYGQYFAAPVPKDVRVDVSTWQVGPGIDADVVF
jgi:hypothetical protein